MITIKIGGSVVDNLHPSTINDIKKVVGQEGVILVHGGGKEIGKSIKEKHSKRDDRLCSSKYQVIMAITVKLCFFRNRL